MFGLTLEELHSASVHVPITLLVLGTLFDLGGYFRRNSDFQLVGFFSLLLGWLGAVSSVVTGWLVQENAITTFNGLGFDDRLVFLIHRLNGFAILTVFAGLLVVRIPKRGSLPEQRGRLYVTVGVIGMLLVLLQGYLGGRMVYGYGVI